MSVSHLDFRGSPISVPNRTISLPQQARLNSFLTSLSTFASSLSEDWGTIRKSDIWNNYVCWLPIPRHFVKRGTCQSTIGIALSKMAGPKFQLILLAFLKTEIVSEVVSYAILATRGTTFPEAKSSNERPPPACSAGAKVLGYGR